MKGHGFSFPDQSRNPGASAPEGSQAIMFEQATIPVQDEATFAVVRQALDDAFAPARSGRFLRRVEGARLRVRQFESILAHGLLGAPGPVGVCKARRCRPGADSRAVSAAGRESRAGSPAEVFQVVRGVLNFRYRATRVQQEASGEEQVWRRKNLTGRSRT